LVIPIEETVGVFLRSVKRTKNSFFTLKHSQIQEL